MREDGGVEAAGFGLALSGLIEVPKLNIPNKIRATRVAFIKGEPRLRVTLALLDGLGAKS